METVGERIKFIRKSKGLTQDEFAKQIGSVQNTVTGYETGRREPSGQVLELIIVKFGVDRIWLETGAGEPFRAESRDEQIARILGSAIGGSGTARDRFIRAVASLPDDKFDWLEQMILQMAEKIKEQLKTE